MANARFKSPTVYTRTQLRNLLGVSDDQLTDMILAGEVPRSDYAVFNKEGRWHRRTVRELIRRRSHAALAAKQALQIAGAAL